jgi:prepilin peptidase CpaA
MPWVEITLDIVLLGICGCAAWTDLRWHRIPDWLTLPALSLGLLVRLFAFGLGGMFDAGLASSLFGAGFGFLVFGLFLIWGKGMGGGDVKLITAVGALAGFRHSLTCVMCTALVGGVLALVLLVVRSRVLATERKWLRDMVVTRVGAEERVTLPYALPIALGAVWATLIKAGVLGGF